MIPALMLCMALAEPPAFVPGPYHEPAFLSLFGQLERGAYRSAELRIGEPSNGHRLILVGHSIGSVGLEAAFKASGWAVLQPPYAKESATLLFYVPPLNGQAEGAQRIVGALAYWLHPGGLFVVPRLELDDFDSQLRHITRFIMSGFRFRLGGIKVFGREFDIYQRRDRRAA